MEETLELNRPIANSSKTPHSASIACRAATATATLSIPGPPGVLREPDQRRRALRARWFGQRPRRKLEGKPLNSPSAFPVVGVRVYIRDVLHSAVQDRSGRAAPPAWSHWIGPLEGFTHSRRRAVGSHEVHELAVESGCRPGAVMSGGLCPASPNWMPIAMPVATIALARGSAECRKRSSHQQACAVLFWESVAESGATRALLLTEVSRRLPGASSGPGAGSNERDPPPGDQHREPQQDRAEGGKAHRQP